MHTTLRINGNKDLTFTVQGMSADALKSKIAQSLKDRTTLTLDVVGADGGDSQLLLNPHTVTSVEVVAPSS